MNDGKGEEKIDEVEREEREKIWYISGRRGIRGRKEGRVEVKWMKEDGVR